MSHAADSPFSMPAPMRIGARTFAWGERTFVMGIVNVTPDSFSGDGLLTGRSADVVAAAVAQSRTMADEGADLLDVDLEGLWCRQLMVVVAVPALELHVGQDDPVAQVGPPSVDWLDRQVPRMIASAVRATRTLARTSWTRTTSAPAAMPRAVVARVASRRWSAGRSRIRPSVDLLDVPSRIGRPSTRSSPSAARIATLCSGVFPKPKPGSTMSCSRATPAPTARSIAPAGPRSPRRRDPRSAAPPGCASARAARRGPRQRGRDCRRGRRPRHR